MGRRMIGRRIFGRRSTGTRPAPVDVPDLPNRTAGRIILRHGRAFVAALAAVTS